MQYITFDEQGNTTGAYLQDMLPEHVGRAVEATDEQCRNWTNLRVVNGALVAVPGPTSEATLAANRAAALEAIKVHRTALKFSGVYVASVGKWFHSDAAESRVQLMGLKDLARDTLAAGGSMNSVLQKLGQDVYWKTMDGSFVPMTCQLAFDVVAAVGDLDAMCHGVAEQHRAAMLAAPDPLAYDWRTGWPAVYEGV